MEIMKNMSDSLCSNDKFSCRFIKFIWKNKFWGASSPLCWFNNKEFLCITHTVEHNYISSSSTVEYSYMFRPYMWAIFKLRFNLQSSYTRCVVRSLGYWGLGGGNEISLFQ